MTVLGGRLPKDHGLGALQAELIDTPERRHIIIAVIDCKKVTTDYDSGEIEPTARILRIEAVTRQDYPLVEQLMRRSLEVRHGQPTLPFDTEREIHALFADFHNGDDG